MALPCPVAPLVTRYCGGCGDGHVRWGLGFAGVGGICVLSWPGRDAEGGDLPEVDYERVCLDQ